MFILQESMFAMCTCKVFAMRNENPWTHQPARLLDFFQKSNLLQIFDSRLDLKKKKENTPLAYSQFVLDLDDLDRAVCDAFGFAKIFEYLSMRSHSWPLELRFC